MSTKLDIKLSSDCTDRKLRKFLRKQFRSFSMANCPIEIKITRSDIIEFDDNVDEDEEYYFPRV